MYLKMKISVEFIQELGRLPICDFCADPRPIVVYRASRMSDGRQVKNWRWCACEICEYIVDNEQWDRMKQRIGAVLMSRSSIPVPDIVFAVGIEMALEEFHKYAIRISPQSEREGYDG